MPCDIFTQSMLLDFIGKVILLIDRNQYEEISNRIGLDKDTKTIEDLTEIAGILYKFISETLCSTVTYAYQLTDKNSNPHIEELKKIINYVDANQKNWYFHTSF